jgi:hypothetical protein
MNSYYGFLTGDERKIVGDFAVFNGRLIGMDIFRSWRGPPFSLTGDGVRSDREAKTSCGSFAGRQ